MLSIILAIFGAGFGLWVSHTIHKKGACPIPTLRCPMTFMLAGLICFLGIVAGINVEFILNAQ